LHVDSPYAVISSQVHEVPTQPHSALVQHWAFSTQAPLQQMPEAAPPVQTVPSGFGVPAGQPGPEPLQRDSPRQSVASAQSEPAGMYPSSGHAGPSPGHTSGTSQFPPTPRHSVPDDT
jgi:hypothetical protein